MSINNAPLVSVCIPAYNHEKYIVDSVNSLVAQTYRNLELIIIDDGSCDSTFKKMKSLESLCKQRFVNVVFQTKQNEGVCETINKLYSQARGKYIFQMSSDDMPKPDAITTLVKFLENHSDYAMAVGDNDVIDGNGRRVYWDENRNNIYSEHDAKYKTFGAFFRACRPDVDFNSDMFGAYSTLFIGNYIPNGYLIRRDILKKIGLFTNDAPLEDWWFMLQVSKYSKIKYIDRVLLSYRWHGKNTSTDAIKMQEMFDKTAEYEWKLLQHANFKDMMPGVKKKYIRECRRRFIHRFIYHRMRLGNVVTIKLFGLVKFKYYKKQRV